MKPDEYSDNLFATEASESATLVPVSNLVGLDLPATTVGARALEDALAQGKSEQTRRVRLSKLFPKYPSSVGSPVTDEEDGHSTGKRPTLPTTPTSVIANL
ncbi:hypothetical protein THARTR1_03941 [Trichoderma harzianum]|uniref:Uncharacterized protein n=1 Tax=Trichoderma harzianum TaxID=5544 RepID=A0A2K0UDZ4_TRIHA|nr:hypothetical protein THARTR1_03941 [Trichoderma harzianum]